MTERNALDTLWSDPANWTSAGFYRCVADPRVWVPKRIGIGYTINIAHRRTWFLFGVLLVVLMAPVVVNVALGRRAPGWLILVTLFWPMAIVAIMLAWLSGRNQAKP